MSRNSPRAVRMWAWEKSQALLSALA
jgi:hypothetical protein